jgi:hypothetical protein
MSTGVESRSATSPIIIQVRPRSGRILLEAGVPWPMVARATLPTLRKGFPPHGSPPSCPPARGPPSRGADSAGALACTAPAVGVNLPAVNQTITFAAGKNFTENQTLAFVTIPTYAGAPNPGEVDVNLTITPIDPPVGFTVKNGPLELRILAPNATTPPMIIGAAGTPAGIKLVFSKPMNPVQASNVHNYKVRETSTTMSGNDDFLDSTVGILSPDNPIGGSSSSKSTESVPLRSATYDPADFTVTLIPKRRLAALGRAAPDMPSFVVTPGSPAKTSAPLRAGSSFAQGLTDLDGNSINQGGKPGKFRILVGSGYTPVG